MKRDIVETGNHKLKSSTINAMNDDSLLLLRNQMGPTATGFKSRNCKRKT